MSQYYIYSNDQSQGPFSVDEIKAQYHPDLYVCPLGGSDWVLAAGIPELQPSAAPDPALAPQLEVQSVVKQEVAKPVEAEQPPADLPEQIKELWKICRSSESELLADQAKKYRKKYFKQELKIIQDEITRRKTA